MKCLLFLLLCGSGNHFYSVTKCGKVSRERIGLAKSREAPCWHLFKQPWPLLGRTLLAFGLAMFVKGRPAQQTPAECFLCVRCSARHWGRNSVPSSGSHEREKAGDGMRGFRTATSRCCEGLQEAGSQGQWPAEKTAFSCVSGLLRLIFVRFCFNESHLKYVMFL